MTSAGIGSTPYADLPYGSRFRECLRDENHRNMKTTASVLGNETAAMLDSLQIYNTSWLAPMSNYVLCV